MKKSLLQKAKELETQKKSERQFTKEEHDLIIALVKDFKYFLSRIAFRHTRLHTRTIFTKMSR